MIQVATNMHQNGSSTKEISVATGVSVRSAQYFVAKITSEYVGGELNEFVVKKRGRAPTDRGNLWQAMEDVLATESTLTQQQIIERLPEDLQVNRNVISKELKTHGYKRKRAKKIPHERNTTRTIQLRKTFAIAVAPLPDANLIFLDESGFNLHLGPLYGYTPPGITPSVEVPGNRGANISLLLAICPTHVVGFFARVGAVTGDDYKTFIETQLLQQMGEDRTPVLIMDNARIHHAVVVKEMLTEHQIENKYLPPYSPQLNPIEEAFSMIKARYRKLTPKPRNSDGVLAALHELVDSFMLEDFGGFYRHMREYLNHAYNEILFD